MESFDVSAKCVEGFEGTAKVKKCSKPGGSYSLSGCSYGGACTAPESTEGYLVTEVELRKTDLDVTAECAPNYIGTAAVTPCSDDLGSYALTGCEAEKKCFSPASDSSEGYDLVENSVAMENFDVTATCKSTHVGTPPGDGLHQATDALHHRRLRGEDRLLDSFRNKGLQNH